jgi:hypothetical protein
MAGSGLAPLHRSAMPPCGRRRGVPPRACWSSLALSGLVVASRSCLAVVIESCRTVPARYCLVVAVPSCLIDAARSCVAALAWSGRIVLARAALTVLARDAVEVLLGAQIPGACGAGYGGWVLCACVSGEPASGSGGRSCKPARPRVPAVVDGGPERQVLTLQSLSVVPSLHRGSDRPQTAQVVWQDQFHTVRFAGSAVRPLCLGSPRRRAPRARRR